MILESPMSARPTAPAAEAGPEASDPLGAAVERFLRFLAVERRAAAHTVEAYEGDLGQLLTHARAKRRERGDKRPLGGQAGPLHLFGHSLGGLLSATWMGGGGPTVQSATLANPPAPASS